MYIYLIPTCRHHRYTNQSVMLETALASGKPLILVLFTNLPMDITKLVADPRVSAIVQAYYPQHWGGQAVVDVLTGAYNPGGRLIATWPTQYDEEVHGSIGNYTMIGTQKTYEHAAFSSTSVDLSACTFVVSIPFLALCTASWSLSSCKWA